MLVQYINCATRLAKRSSHRDYKLGALLIRGGRILASAVNAPRYSGHAEMVAIRRAGDVTNGILIVIRRTRSGRLSMSKPCEKCMYGIVRAGIRRVIFSNWTGQIESLSTR